MKFNFKKIASVLAGTVMMSSTLAFAVAANYPAPFVKSGNADVAVVYGSQPGAEFDLLAVADITQNLQASLAKQTAVSGSSTTSSSVTGEAAALFTGGTKLYMNDTLNIVKSSLTDTQLPVVLKDGSFSGNVDTTYTQSIDIGFNPQFTFAKQPSSSEDPTYALTTSSSTGNYIYNASVTFNKAANLTHADSEGQDITMFGQKFTIASATDDTKLVLLKTAEKVSLSSDAPSTEVTIKGKKYTVELVSASDTAATVKVTGEDGVSETKEINENASKKVGGITVAVTNADETNLKLSASVIAGAEKVTLSGTAGSTVTYGEEDTNIDGTTVTITGGPTATTKITVSVLAKDSDHDSINGGTSLVDPVFGTFKLNFAGLNVPENSTTRENIVVSPNGDDKLQVKFTDYHNKEATISYAKNYTGFGPIQLQYNDDAKNITVREKERITKDGYVVVGNEDEASLLKITYIYNSSTTGTSGDKISYTDVFTGENKDMDIGSADGSATLNIAGKSFTVTYNGSTTSETNWILIDYPDSTGSGDIVAYPTIETSKGAKLAFYEPLNLSFDSIDSAGTNLSNIRLPDGDGYTNILVENAGGEGDRYNVTIGSGTLTGLNTSKAGVSSVSGTIGKLTYNITGEGTVAAGGRDRILLYLVSPQGGNIVDPALVIFEEKDDNTNYEALIVTAEAGATADDGMGVNDVVRTWSGDTIWDAVALASDSKKTKDADLWGTITTLDNGDSDQSKATISYPDEQLYGEVYVAENSAEITAGTTSSGSGSVKELGSVAVKDSEVAQVSTKNLVVVGGSCVNTLASQLLDGAGCGASFEQKTGVGSGSFLIQTFARTGDKVATLVAGYNVDDTRNAAKALTTQVIDTSATKKYKSTSATTVALQSSTTASTTSTTTNTTRTNATA